MAINLVQNDKRRIVICLFYIIRGNMPAGAISLPPFSIPAASRAITKRYPRQCYLNNVIMIMKKHLLNDLYELPTAYLLMFFHGIY